MERVSERSRSDEPKSTTPARRDASLAHPVSAVLALQRSAGNRAVTRMLATARLDRRIDDPALDGTSSKQAIADAITGFLVADGVQEQALGRNYVSQEVKQVVVDETSFDGVILPPVQDAEAHPIATIAAPIRAEIRARRDARHMAWLRSAKQRFDATLGGTDKRADTLRSHAELTGTERDRQASSHYARTDAALGALDQMFLNQEILWRFTSRPAQEGIVVGANVQFDRLVRQIGAHTGGNRKDDPEVRTLSFGRNLGALVGVAHSTGGDANVAAIAVRAEYLYGVSLASLAGQGITAHPAESRLIGIFETEYVLVGTPGDPERKLELLATHKFLNPFKARGPDAVETPLIPGKQLPKQTTPAPAADPASPGLRQIPQGFSDVIKLEAKRIQAAASKQAGVVQDKEPTMGSAIDGAMRIFHENLESATRTITTPNDVPAPTRAPRTLVRPDRSQLTGQNAQQRPTPTVRPTGPRPQQPVPSTRLQVTAPVTAPIGVETPKEDKELISS